MMILFLVGVVGVTALRQYVPNNVFLAIDCGADKDFTAITNMTYKKVSRSIGYIIILGLILLRVILNR